MSERDDLLVSIAGIIKDYRAGNVTEPTPEHVERWVRQFGAPVQVSMLRELDHILRKTYFSKGFVSRFFADQIMQRQLAGKDPCAFWRAAHLLNIQQHGNSQSEILALFGEALRQQCGLAVEDCGAPGGCFIYLDDVLFSGSRIGTDLSAWIRDEAPAEATVHILVIASHQLGEWQCSDRLEREAADAGKRVDFRWRAAVRFENRKAYRDRSEVLWPMRIPADPAVQAYVAEAHRFPFEPRQPGGRPKNEIFSSEEGRQLLEHELLVAGARIRSFSRSPNQWLRPLGFSAYGLGFGSMVVTFRNGPNNTPLALWWGDPSAAPGHPFRNWYPLLPRKTYAQGAGFGGPY